MVINWGSNGSQTVIGWRWVVIECDGWGSDVEVDDPLGSVTDFICEVWAT
jgi:hypothetical protein